MTNEEAIEWIQYCIELIKQDVKDCFDDKDIPALNMAIEALKQVTGKLRNPDDSLLTEDSDACKESKSKLDLIFRSDAIDALGEEPDIWNDTEEEWAYRNAWVEHISAIKSLPSAEPKTDGVFVKGGLTISGEPPMPEGCMDCKLQDRCLCIPPDLSADEISELYISRRPNCPLSMIAEMYKGGEEE